ncbi:NAD(P) transhydrogenase beta subunit [Kribbella orskensis]|uniref:NAD(P) transhydrogenase beta subunit n=1 Tax=Kribbella orskensis TaxID=2512216 RepID=A0ABY2B834_9ACTN|nr:MULTISPECIES: NAD(P)(+) transhydrogenase (Re/Si-specific) subunit beta [Kribbella]TCN30678.1 NAD(P) transhydrogenase beta subunit [Kribbella sp. VKM Ac-2500]TCO11397.1 NAD(P) transhydrogenase beta subunit [Kribbella orskensis]
MTDLETGRHLAYLAAAAMFIIGLHLIDSPRTARRGNFASGAGMVLALATSVIALLYDGTAPHTSGGSSPSPRTLSWAESPDSPRHAAST